MDIEELNKSQIVMLTLFVSFITSIATGIVTVSLMQQAPPVITQTVSRVIQETVQTVAPSSGSQRVAATVTQERTVVVNAADLISKAVAQATPSIVRLYVGTSDAPTFAGLGLVLDGNGSIAADSEALGDNADVSVVLSDGTTARAFVRHRDAATGIAYLMAATSTAPAPKWVPMVVASDHIVLGQTVVALSGKNIPRIGSGLVSALMPGGTASTAPQINETDVAQGSIMPGSPLIDTTGALVGLNTAVSRAVSASDFLSASALIR